MPYRKQSMAHVHFHVAVIKRHYFNETLEGCYSDQWVEGLGGFTNNLHYVVTLVLNVKMAFGKLERVKKCIRCS